MYRQEDDSVYKVKGGFLEIPLTNEMYRDRLILGRRDGAVTVTVSKGPKR